MGRVSIRIFKNDLTFVREINNFKVFTFERGLYTAGKFKLQINIATDGSSEFKYNRIIMLDKNIKKVGIIKSVQESISTTGEEILEVKGYEIKGIVSQRTTIPPTGLSHLSFVSQTAETIIKETVLENCIDNRPFPLLEMATDQLRGGTYDFSTRYKNLETELESFCKLSELGYLIYLDITNKKYIFEIIEGTDHSSSSANPVFFSKNYGNISDEKYLISYFNSANYAIVAGQGEGVLRTIVEIGTTDTGFELYESFIDARDINTTDELTARGNEKLADLAPTESFESTILPFKNFIYGTDFDLGDIVTFKSIQGVQLDKRIERITEFYQSGIENKVQFQFGNTSQNTVSYINNKVDTGVQ